MTAQHTAFKVAVNFLNKISFNLLKTKDIKMFLHSPLVRDSNTTICYKKSSVFTELKDILFNEFADLMVSCGGLHSSGVPRGGQGGGGTCPGRHFRGELKLTWY